MQARLVPIAMAMLFVAGCGSSGAPSMAETAASAAPRGSALIAEPAPSRPPTEAPAAQPSSPAAPSPIALPSMDVDTALPVAWETAGPAGERPWTWTPAVDPDGRVWAASSFDDVFWIFEPDGTFLEAWGTPGRDDGELRLNDGSNGFGAIAFRADGGFYVADSGNARIQEFDANRELVRTWGSFGTEPGAFISPIGIELDGDGNVYVYDDNGRGDLKQFQPDGTFSRVVATAVGPYMAVAGDGTIVAFDHLSETLVRIAPDGARTLSVDIGAVVTFCTDIALAPDGSIFLASSTNSGTAFEYEHLLELGPDGTLRHVWPDGAEGIALDSARGRLYLTFSDRNPAVRAVDLPDS